MLSVYDPGDHGGEDPYEGQDDAVAGCEKKILPTEDKGHHRKDKKDIFLDVAQGL